MRNTLQDKAFGGHGPNADFLRLFEEREGVKLSPGTLRRYLKAAGLKRSRPTRMKKAQPGKEPEQEGSASPPVVRYTQAHRDEGEGQRCPHALADAEWDLVKDLFEQKGPGRPPDDVLLSPASMSAAASGPERRVVLDIGSSGSDICDRLTEVEEVESELPGWFGGVLEDLSRLLSLQEDWDSYGRDSIRLEVAASVLRFLLELPEGVPRPRLEPHSSGGVGLEWTTARAELSLSIGDPSGDTFVLEDFVEGGDVEGLLSDRERLTEVFERLS